MAIGDWWWILFHKKVRTYYLVGRGLASEQTECKELVEAVGMAQDLARDRKITVYVCEVRAMTDGRS